MINKFYSLFLLQGGERFKSLEGIRALAIFLVFNVHVLSIFHDKSFYTQNELLINFYKTLSAGHIGVDLFFVLSGFLIVRTISKSKSIFQFMGNRYKRLWPVVFVTTLALVLKSHSAIAAFDNLTLLMFFTKQPLNFVNWSLTYEIYFYFFTAVWFFYFTKVSMFKNKGIYLFGTLLILMFCLLRDQSEYFFIREPFRFIGFFWGILLADLYDSAFYKTLTDKKITKWIWAIPLLSIPVLQMAWGVYGVANIQAASLGSMIFYLIVQIQFFLLLLSILDPNSHVSRLFSLDIFRYLGTISYSFYIIHWIWGLKLTSKVLKNFPEGQIRIGVTYLVGFGLSVLFASILFLCLEKPYFKKRYR